ncbi:AMP-binding protein [Alicyclobacillus dauci]|uniref:AMP-binding protein n=1 Tax=Alicyclobacillus dauci TaxID=1475485 RepID=A0ABY6Z0A3_9BACL|nr:AMP-binding protein [Alicyclobacillus dauci]WAH36300.1 AMP-binding protein [Alicyclobacillus dauci]
MEKEWVERYQSMWPNKTILDYLDASIAQVPDKTAIFDRRSRYTYRELGRLADRVALGLLELGVGKGDVISIQLPNWNEFIILHIAATRIGAITNPLVPIYRDREIGYMVGLAESKMLVVPDEFRGFRYPEMVQRLSPEWPFLKHVFVVGEHVPPGMHGFSQLLEEPWEQRTDPAVLNAISHDPNEVTYLIFTSGTTGEPKGVLHTHNTLCVSADYWIEHLKLTTNDVIFMASTFAHQTGFVYGARLPLHFGGTGVYQDIWNAEEFIRLIEEEKVSVTAAATPFLYDTVQAPGVEQADLSSFRVFASMGAPIPRSLVRQAANRLPCKILSGWGQTENGLVTLTALDDSEEKITGTDGHPFPGMEVRVVDKGGNRCPAGQEGDLHCRGPALFVGYFKRSEYTASQFEDGWFHTGDRAVMDEDGYIRITGREKDIIIRGGENIPVSYVENILYEHRDISVAQVVGMPDPRLQERACAYIRMKPGKEPVTLETLQTFLLEKGLAKQYWPERVEIIQDFPQTPSGKIQKFHLREMIKRKLIAEGVLEGE